MYHLCCCFLGSKKHKTKLYLGTSSAVMWFRILVYALPQPSSTVFTYISCRHFLLYQLQEKWWEPVAFTSGFYVQVERVVVISLLAPRVKVRVQFFFKTQPGFWSISWSCESRNWCLCLFLWLTYFMMTGALWGIDNKTESLLSTFNRRNNFFHWAPL